MSLRKKILIGLAVVFIIIQFFTINKTNPPVEAGIDMIKVEQVPTQIEGILRTSCYDILCFFKTS